MYVCRLWEPQWCVPVYVYCPCAVMQMAVLSSVVSRTYGEHMYRDLHIMTIKKQQLHSEITLDEGWKRN